MRWGPHVCRAVSGCVPSGTRRVPTGTEFVPSGTRTDVAMRETPGQCACVTHFAPALVPLGTALVPLGTWMRSDHPRRIDYEQVLLERCTIPVEPGDVRPGELRVIARVVVPVKDALGLYRID